ncbi:MAG TPA: carbohydrate ABC transporter permease [Candidatus Limnocylindrales bacterium]|jgi:ABC-type glycerol-3-phosphate transport system permease component
MIRRPTIRSSTVILIGLAAIWSYPVLWTLANAFKTTADLYQGPLALPIPPAVENIGAAWDGANLGGALLNSAYVASLTVAGALGLAVPAAFALTCLRPPWRAALFLVILAPLIIPTEVLIVPLFSIFRTLGLINSLPGLALVNVVFSVSFATIILAGYFRRIPADVIDAGRMDGAGRLTLLTSLAIPLVRPGLVAVGLLVAVFAWNDFAGAVVLIQRPDSFTAPLAVTTFTTFYATNEGLRFAGLAITFLPPLIAFLLLQRSFVQGLTIGTAAR